MMEKTYPLTVYKASAGSGKTFRLAVEYIRLLIENPDSYRNILAVTFTNKATEEMKMRILSQLYGIAHGLPDSDSYFHELKKSLEAVSSGYKWYPELIRQRASTALSNLLANYNHFRVMTIDSFFQIVLRNLAQELQLTANLRVSLNEEELKDLAVDRLIDNMRKEDQVFHAIISYMYEKIDENKSWNVIRQIKKFGKHIFRDYYKDNHTELQHLLEPNENGYTPLQDITYQLKRIIDEEKGSLVPYGEKFFQLIESYDLSIDDFKSKSKGIYTYFRDLRQGEYDDKILGRGSKVRDSMESADAWVGTSKHKEKVREVAQSHLIGLLNIAEAERRRLANILNTAELTRAHLYQLSLLAKIDKEVQELNKETNCFFLSDTQHLLRAMIGQDDAPFVYEKIGANLHHIMIDEFQDTSRVQWNNFKVLMLDCMSRRDSHNLIVGDVKQSIYRWRSGDWRLLNDIKGEFKSHYSQVDEMVDEKPLRVNRRSSSRVITFNNVFFPKAVEEERQWLSEQGVKELEQMTTAYGDVEQEIPDGKPDEGYVRVSLFDKNNFEDHVLQALLSHVTTLVERGIPYTDIAILIRYNDDIPIIAKYFIEHCDIPIVSDLAFRLDASLSVNTIIMALRFLVAPNDDLNRAALSNIWHRRILKDTPTMSELFVIDGVQRLSLPRELEDKRMNLLSMPLNELVEHLITLLELEKLDGQDPYLYSFLDCLHEFLSDDVADVDGFLAAWDDELHRKTIQAESVDGIRVISIHGSKGLEFPHVIIPFCDWGLDRNDNEMWCKPHSKEKPYKELPVVPITYGKKASNSMYAPFYFEECLQNEMDNLNLLYVAFTRAIDGLVVFGKAETKRTRSSVIQGVIEQVAHSESLESSVFKHEGEEGFESLSHEGELLVFEYGEIKPPKKKEIKKTDNVFLQDERPLPLQLRTFPIASSFSQSNESTRFIKEDEQEETRHHYMKIGSILHEVFARIATFDDIPHVLRELEMGGVLYNDEIGPDDVKRLIDRNKKNEEVKDWYSGRWTVLTECTILNPTPTADQSMHPRPDRVMICKDEAVVVDFKFGKPRDEHKKQVSHYKELLQAMGYPSVKGYLWYVYKGFTLKV